MTSLIMLATDPASEAGGFSISVVSIIVVFVVLAILILIFMGIPKMLESNIKNKLKKSGKKEKVTQPADVNAAIAMALHLYINELHDEESNIITIRNAQKQYSPWNSKIYGVHNQPVRK